MCICTQSGSVKIYKLVDIISSDDLLILNSTSRCFRSYGQICCADMKVTFGKMRSTGRAPPAPLTANQTQIVKRLIDAHGDDVQVLPLKLSRRTVHHLSRSCVSLLCLQFWLKTCAVGWAAGYGQGPEAKSHAAHRSETAAPFDLIPHIPSWRMQLQSAFQTVVVISTVVCKLDGRGYTVVACNYCAKM